MKHRRLYTAYGALCVATLVLYSAAWLFSISREKVENWVCTEAVIVAMEEERVPHSRRKVRLYPRFCFTAEDGQSHSVRSQTENRWLSCECGERVRVYYPQEKPEDALIYTFLAFYRWPLALALVGGIQSLFGAALLIIARPEHPWVKALKAWFCRA